MLTTLLVVLVISTLLGRLVALDGTVQGITNMLSILFVVALAVGIIDVLGKSK